MYISRLTIHLIHFNQLYTMDHSYKKSQKYLVIFLARTISVRIKRSRITPKIILCQDRK